MSPTWLIITILAALATAMAILTIGHQSEERPGYLDLTGYPGLRPLAGYQWPQASRPRAQAGGRCVHCGAEPIEWPRAFSQEFYEAHRCPSGLAHFFTSDHRVLAAFLGRKAELAGMSETELARRVATQEQPRGADAA